MTDTPNIVTSTSSKGRLERAMKPLAAGLIPPTIAVALAAVHPLVVAHLGADAPVVVSLPDAVLPHPEHDHRERVPGPPQRLTGFQTSATGLTVPSFTMDGLIVLPLRLDDTTVFPLA